MNYSEDLCFPSQRKLLCPKSEPADKQACVLLSHPKLYESNGCNCSPSLLASIDMFTEAAAPRRAAQGLAVSKRGGFCPVKSPLLNSHWMDRFLSTIQRAYSDLQCSAWG